MTDSAGNDNALLKKESALLTKPQKNNAPSVGSFVLLDRRKS